MKKSREFPPQTPASEIQELKKLFDDGALAPAEFEAAKKKVIGIAPERGPVGFAIKPSRGDGSAGRAKRGGYQNGRSEASGASPRA